MGKAVANRRLCEPGEGAAYASDVRVEHVPGLDSSSGSAFLVRPDGGQIEIPAELCELFESLARQVSRGHAVQIVTYNREITTQQAAELLNVSRQYLIKLLNRGEIPFTRTQGSHRRLRLDDVLEYRRRRAEQRGASLDRLARASLEMGGY